MDEETEIEEEEDELLKPRGLFSKKKRSRTPTIIQMEAVECGAASLAIVLAYYECRVPLEELRVKCGVSRDGSSALNVVTAAKEYGLEANAFQMELDDLAEVPTPAILFWNFNHFVVLEYFSKEKIYINDPASGPRRVSYEECDQAFTGVILAFRPGPNFQKRGGKATLLPMLWERLQGVKSALTYLTLMGLCLVLPGLALPAFTQIFIDDVLINGLHSWKWGLVGGLACTLVAVGIMTWLQLYFLNRLGAKMQVKFAGEFLWHILRLPVVFFTQRFGGEIAYRTSLNITVSQILTGQLATTVISSLLIIFYAIFMFQYDVTITFVAIGAAILNFVTMILINRTRTDAYARLQQEIGKSLGVATGALQNIETLKATATESDFFSRWAGYYAKNLNALQDIGKKDVVLAAVPTILQALTTLTLLAIGAYKIMNGVLTVGMLMALATLMGAFLAPVMRFVGLAQMLQTLRVDIARLNDVLLNPRDPILVAMEENNATDTATPLKLDGYLELRNVTFGYSRVDPPLLVNFSLKLTPGQRVALVGPSGCGKSTIARLVSGLYEPWEGEILYDGKPLKALPRRTMMGSLGLVDQEIFLFSASLRDNLTLWDPTISDDQMIRAAKDAGLHDEIVSHSRLGYDMQLFEGGANLSGGQRQRLEIARSLVQDPRILIMDEATSALDSKTEETVAQNVRRRGCTCLMIAHRLSTIRDSDEIIVLDHGKVLQRGTHEDLRASPGLYRELIRAEGSLV